MGKVNNNQNVPEEGTREYQIYHIKMLRNWLSKNPKNNPVVDKEKQALDWALKELGEE